MFSLKNISRQKDSNLPPIALETRMLPQDQLDICERIFKLIPVHTSKLHCVLLFCQSDEFGFFKLHHNSDSHKIPSRDGGMIFQDGRGPQPIIIS